MTPAWGGVGVWESNLRTLSVALAHASRIWLRASRMFQDPTEPRRTYLFKDVYKDIIIRNPKKEGFIGLR